MPQPSTLPIYYSGSIVGHTSLDRDTYDLISSRRISLILPKSVRSRHPGRPDIILALLRDDPTLIHRCHPAMCIDNHILHLSHIALRTPQLTSTLCSLSTRPAYRLALYPIIRHITSDIQRIVFVSGSRIDCQRANLRELSPHEPEGLDPTL